MAPVISLTRSRLCSIMRVDGPMLDVAHPKRGDTLLVP